MLVWAAGCFSPPPPAHGSLQRFCSPLPGPALLPGRLSFVEQRESPKGAVSYTTEPLWKISASTRRVPPAFLQMPRIIRGLTPTSLESHNALSPIQG